MSQYEKMLCVGDITFLIQSEHEFSLSERCLAFEQNIENPDVIIILKRENFDFSNCPVVYAGSNFDILQTEHATFTLRYTNEQKKRLAWYFQKTDTKTYTVTFAETFAGAYHCINPLFFFDLAEFLISYNAIILHSAVITINEKAIAFTAPSQTGKSTQAELWEKYKNAEILNGDRGLIRFRNDEYKIYGSPYAGSSHIYVNQSATLGAIVVLKQAPQNTVKKIHGKEAYLHLLSQTSVSPWNKKTIEQESLWLLNLLHSIPVYLLECRPDQDAVEILYTELEGILNE